MSGHWFEKIVGWIYRDLPDVASPHAIKRITEDYDEWSRTVGLSFRYRPACRIMLHDWQRDARRGRWLDKPAYSLKEYYSVKHTQDAVVYLTGSK